MKIPVLGMDPSLTNWGLAFSQLDLTTGFLDDPELLLVSPTKIDHKQVRQNSKDIYVAEQLSAPVFEYAKKSKVVFVEVPVGSQSARAMASYGVCIGILGFLRSQGIQLIEVTPLEVKFALSGDKHATKEKMIDKAVGYYPNSNWPKRSGKIVQKAEHLADAVGSIHAGVKTQAFQNLIRLFKEIRNED